MRLLITGGSGFIGVHAVRAFTSRCDAVCNVDRARPLDASQQARWYNADIMDEARLLAVFREFGPTHVLHLAARADCEEGVPVLPAYAANVDGVGNLLAAVRQTPSVERLVVTSSQFVCGPGRLPAHDEDFFPHTVYGESKVRTEQLTRAFDGDVCWTIVRPTNIWGPWHYRYAREAWSVIRRGVYLHPGGPPVIRAYGYVKNVVWQLEQLFAAPMKQVHGQVYYLGDAPGDIYEWVDAFSMALRGQHARKAPRALLRAIGLAGDVITRCGVAFPLTSPRFRSMTTDYLVPMEKSLEQFGYPPHTLESGVEETCRWLSDEVGGIYQAAC